MTFTSREMAAIFWVVVSSIWVVFQKNMRGSLWELIQSAFSMWKYFLLLLLYISLSVWVLYKISFWNIELLKVTIYWVFGWSVITFVNLNKVQSEKDYLKNLLKEIFSLTVVIAFFINFYAFSFWVELFLVPFATLLSLLIFISGMEKEYQPTHSFLSYVQMIFGVSVLLFFLYQLIINLKTFANFSTLSEFFLPMILSLMLIPLLYGMSFYSLYEQEKIRKKYLISNND